MPRNPMLDIINRTLRNPRFQRPVVGHELRGPMIQLTGDRTDWVATVPQLAEALHTALYGRPSDTPDTRSPLAQAEEAKRARNLGGEIDALMSAGVALASAPWYPACVGDLVHVHYEPSGMLPAFGETYVVTGSGPSGLGGLQLVGHTCPGGAVDFRGGVGAYAVEDSDDPLSTLWFEAGPQRLAIVRDGRVVHDGAAPRPRPAGLMLKTLGDTIGEAERYLELGDPAAALARLRSVTSLPPCGAPGFVPEQADCARWKNHGGACSENPDYVDPPHECPALPEQLHAVVTIGAKVQGVHFAGLYEEREAAVDQATGFAAFSEELIERYVKPAPGLPDEMVLELPGENAHAAFGVQLVAVVPLKVLPDPREYEAWAEEGRAACEEYDPDYGKDLDDEDDDQDGEDGVAQ